MKALGKIAIIILYWTLIALFVWLFYDEYITEHKFSSLCFCIAFVSLGCSLHNFLILQLYETELAKFEKLYVKVSKILSVIILLVTFILLGISVIAFLMGSIGGLIYLCIYGIVTIICNTWIFWLIIILLFVLCMVFRIFCYPVLRVISKIFYRISLISIIALIIYIEVDVWSTLMHLDSFEENSLVAGSVILLLLCGFPIYLLYVSMKKGILSLAQYKYVLFLRAFKDDDRVKSLYNKLSLSIHNIPLMKIGNPINAESEDINEHWLPFSNWKFFIKFYISRAKAVVIVASLTDGVIWEVVQNIKYLNKCIIYFASPDELMEFKNRLLSVSNNNLDVIIYSIEKILKSREYKNAFVVRNNNIYIGEVSVLINSVLKNDFEKIKFIANIDSITNNSQYKNSRGSISDFIFRYFHILSVINNLETTHNNTFVIFVKGIVAIVVIAIYLFGSLMGVGMILFPLVIWFGHNVDWLGVSYEDYGTVAKVLMTWFGISCGVGLLKNLYDKD